MTVARRWDPAISYQGEEAIALIQSLSRLNQSCLVICGAGFDPRSAMFAELLQASGTTDRRGLFIREHRDRPEPNLSKMAEANLARLTAAIPSHSIVDLQVFEEDGAVTIGRNAAAELHRFDLGQTQHIFVDTSALSIGASFPILKYLVQTHNPTSPELHVVSFHDPLLDASVKPLPADNIEFVHGFQGGFGLDQKSAAATLWLPQLAPSHGFALGRLHSAIDPADTCPILPFPSSDPRAADELVAEYVDEFSSWQVDSRSVVFASEGNPIDLYRTILDLHDMRSQVFREAGGSQIVLSPLGSKVTALGSLLAALEYDLPVAYVESVGFEYAPKATVASNGSLTHVWLEGSVYPSPRPPMTNHGI